jgi:hypothetical protein
MWSCQECSCRFGDHEAIVRHTALTGHAAFDNMVVVARGIEALLPTNASREDDQNTDGRDADDWPGCKD